MEKPSVQRIVACHALYLRRVEQKSFTWLRDVGKPDTGQTSNIFGWVLAADILLHADRLGPHCTPVIAHDRKHAFHERTFPVSRRRAKEDKQAFKPCIATQSVSIADRSVNEARPVFRSKLKRSLLSNTRLQAKRYLLRESRNIHLMKAIYYTLWNADLLYKKLSVKMEPISFPSHLFLVDVSLIYSFGNTR